MGYNMRNNRDSLIKKLNEIQSTMISLENYCKQWRIEYEIITDQYMNGNIDYDIGKEQRAIIKRIKKAEKEYSKLQNDAFKIRQKLSM